MSRTTGYSVSAYGEMILDRVRTQAYVDALRRAITPGCTVLDIGAGTGFFSLLACAFGAGRVYAVEPDDAIEVARAGAVANGVEDKVVFLAQVSTAVELPSPADVIISDLRGPLPLLEHHIPSIIDARARLLAPGGHLIPRADTLWVALVEDAHLYRGYEEPWLRNDYGLDLRAGHGVVTNRWHRVHLGPDRLLVEPQRWAEIDYATVEEPNVANTVSWTVERAGVAHGLLVWFDAAIDDEHGFSNAPGRPELIYGQAFFPWSEPLPVRAGDVLDVDLRADLIGEDYTWSWGLDHHPVERSGRPEVSLRQSTFHGAPLSPSRLRRRAATYTPGLSPAGVIDRHILDLMDGRTSLDAIARQVADAHPEAISGPTEALARVRELSLRFGT